MSETTHAEVIELSLEKTIETKLIQSNITEQVLAALKEKYGGMKLKSVDDKESYLELKSAAKDCAKVRTLAVKVCIEGRARAVKEQKLWISEEKRVVGEVAIVENALDAEIKLYDDNEARLKQEELNRQEEAYINRQAVLTKMGATYKDGSFILGEASFEANLIKGSSEDVWQEAIVPKFKLEYEKIESVRVAEKKEKAEKEAELKRQQDELQKQQLELKKQQEELQRQKDEAQRAEDKKNTESQRSRFELLYPFNPSGSDVNMTTLLTLSDIEFNSILESKKEYFTKQKEENDRLAEEKRLADIEQARQDAVKKEQERQAEEARLAAIKKQQEEEKKEAELAAASDKTKWAEFVKEVGNISFFDMKSTQYKAKMQSARFKINEILAL